MEFYYNIQPSFSTEGKNDEKSLDKWSIFSVKGKKYIKCQHKITITKSLIKIADVTLKPGISIKEGDTTVKVNNKIYDILESSDDKCTIIINPYKSLSINNTQTIWITKIFDYSINKSVIVEFDYIYTDHIIHKYTQKLLVPFYITSNINYKFIMDDMSSLFQKIGKSIETYTENEIKGVIESLYN